MKRSFVIPAALCLLLLSLPAGAAIHRVRLGATGLNNGTSWENARTDLHATLLAANPGDSVWVAEGTWFADWNAATGTRTGDRERRFTLKTGVTVLGGFAGTETSASQRDWWNHSTILSGDIPQSGGSNNTKTIMATPTAVTGCVVEGFTFTGGYADDPNGANFVDVIGGNGGALFLRGDVIVQNCLFRVNYAHFGGAVHVAPGTANLRLRQCFFVHNDSTYEGAAVSFQAGGQQFEVTACTFLSNFPVNQSKVAVAMGSSVAVWKGNLVTASQVVQTGSASSVRQWNIWGTLPPGSDPAGEGNIVDAREQFLNTIAGPDNTVGTDDDVFLLELMAGSSAINRVPVAALPPDVTDADGDGNVTEPIPFDLSHRQRVRDGAADSGVFEMVNVAPTDITVTLDDNLEERPAGTRFAWLNATDPNGPGDTFSLAAGEGDTDNTLFRIEGSALLTTAELEYETKPVVSVRVRVVDLLGLALEKQLLMPVQNRIERTVHFEVLKGTAWEPAGGISGRTGPGGWPEHWASLRIVRTGEQGPVDVRLSIDDRTYIGIEDGGPSDGHFGMEFRLHTAQGEVTPLWAAVIHFDAGQNEVLVGVEPLFDWAPDESAGEAEIFLADGGEDYRTGTPASAVIKLYDSPSRAWASLPDRAAIPPDQLASFALGGTPEGSGLQLRTALLSGPQPEIEITGTLNPAAKDVSLSWEQSADLQVWAAVEPAAVSYSGGEVRWRFAAAAARTFLRPRGVVSAQATGVGAGISSSFAYIPAGPAWFGPPTDEPSAGSIRYQQLRPFWIARTELRNGDPASIDIFLPGASQDHPATGFTRDELTPFLIKATSQQFYGTIPPGYELRLPTEAEWLFAASQPLGVPDPATPLASRTWYLDNAFGAVHRCGMKLPDSRGLHDILGNVSEWTRGRLQLPDGASVADETSIVSDGGWPVVCGGNILLGEWAQTVTHRFSYPVSEAAPVIGVRLVIAPVLALP